MPLISVILPIHNGERYLQEALSSVLGQTEQDFEVIAVNDHSNDHTSDILASIQDSRLRVLTLSDERGLVAGLNAGLLQASGSYIARMDADDICLPHRFEMQCALFSKNDEIGLVYGDAHAFSGAEEGRLIQSAEPERLKEVLTLQASGMTIVHPTVMIRRTLLLQVGGYRLFSHAEDRDLWLRLVGKTRFAKTSQPLLRYRVNPEGVSQKYHDLQRVSRLLAVLCHESRERLNFDFFEEAPDLALELRHLLGKRMARWPEPREKLATARAALESRNVAALLRESVELALEAPRIVSPGLRVKRERALVDALLTLVQAFVNGQSALAPSLASAR